MCHWTNKFFFTLSLILYCLLKFLCDPHLTVTNLLFLRKSASVATSRLRIFTLLLPIVAGVALDVLGNWNVQLFCHTNNGRFILCPQDCGKCDTCHLPVSKATPYTLGIREGLHIQPIRIKEKVKNRFSLVEEFQEVVSENFKAAGVNTCRLPEKK